MKVENKLKIIFFITIVIFFCLPRMITSEEITSPYLPWLQDRCAIYEVPMEIVLAVAIVESNFKMVNSSPNTNGSYDIGIMQINSRYLDYFEETFWYKHRVFNPHDPHDNIEMGILILKNLFEQTGEWDQAVRAYNTGLHAVKHAPDRSHSYLVKVVNVLNTLELRRK